MYTPKHFEETRLEVLHALMRAHPLGTFVTRGPSELTVNHIPFHLDVGGASLGKLGVLRGHVSRANPVWRELADEEAVVVFQGPNAYISPSWYPSKHAHGKAVPTWNYAVVHAHGRPRVIEGAEWLVRHLGELTDEHESEQALPWKLTDAPQAFTARLLEAVVGIEIPVSRLCGSWKVSQNRPPADRLGVAAGLESRKNPGARAMAQLVTERSAAQAAAEKS
jgi:transcriptional regulator